MPDAPAPTRNSLGDIIGGWTVTVTYDEAADEIIVNHQVPGSKWRKSGRWANRYGPSDLEDAISDVQVSVRTFGARRLF